MIARWFPTGATLDLTVSRHKCEFEDPPARPCPCDCEAPRWDRALCSRGSWQLREL